MVFFALLLIGLIVFAVVYVLWLRPLLVARFKTFYAEADGFWETASAFVFKSATVAWSYIVMAAGFLMMQLQNVATLLGDPDFKTQISNAIGADTKTLGLVMLGISVVTFAVRMRGVAKD